LYFLVTTKLIYINVDSFHEIITELDSTYDRNPSVKHTHTQKYNNHENNTT